MTDADGLAGALDALRGARWIDLTHPFAPGVPHFAAFPDEERSLVTDHPESGFRAHRHCITGQWGTHVDAPVHTDPAGASLSELAVEEMLCPLVVLEAREQTERDPGFVAGPELVAAHEAAHGAIPAGAFVALRTGWSSRWPDPDRFANGGRTPGWGVEAVRILVVERSATAIGHEQMDTDPGAETTRGRYPAERFLLGAGCWQIELLASLDAVPERGALILASWPRPEGGSGFPARCVAIVPA